MCSWRVSRGGFLIRRSSAIRRFFAGFLRCDNRTIMNSFLRKIAREFSGNFVGCLCKFAVNSRANCFEKILHYCTTIALQKSCDKPANRRAASDEKLTPGIARGGGGSNYFNHKWALRWRYGDTLARRKACGAKRGSGACFPRKECFLWCILRC